MAGVVFWEAGEATFHLSSPWRLSFRLLLAERSFQFYTHSAAPSPPLPSLASLDLTFTICSWRVLFSGTTSNETPGLFPTADLSLVSGVYGIPCFISNAFGVSQMRWGSVFQSSLRCVCSTLALLVLGGVTARSCHSKCSILKFWINNCSVNPASSADLDVVDLIMSRLHAFTCFLSSFFFFFANTFILFPFNWWGGRWFCYVFLYVLIGL